MQTLSLLPEPGQVVHVRMCRWLVEQIEPRAHDDDATLVKLACLADAQGDPLSTIP